MKNLKADVLIIGGGITGVTTAYCLADKGLKPILIEAGGLCDGTTGNTTGKVTIQHSIIYSKILSKYGLNAASAYAASQSNALDFVKNTVTKESIDCQLIENTAYVFASKPDMSADIKKEYNAAQQIGITSELLTSPIFPVENCMMLGFTGQAVFHPVRYVDGLAKAAVQKGAEIYCSTKAVKVENGEIKKITCDNDIEIETKNLVIATGYPIYDGPNLFFARLYPKRTYGIAVRARKPWPEGSYITAGKPTRSFRTHVENGEPILVVVGDGHDTGRGPQDMTVHYEHLMQFADKLADVQEVVAMWSAQDYESPDGLPYIGRISDNSDIFVATGYRKWGLTNGTLAGNLLTDLITTGNSGFEGLFSRTRADFISSPGKALYGAVSPIVELVKSKLEGTDSIDDLKPGEGRVIRYKGEKAGIYRSDNDDVTIVDITCTHMRTELNFNNAEKTWDCPAHGGRFGTDGRLLEGPPKNPLKILFRGKFDDLIKGD